jgi:hypothetical protein
MCKEFDPGDLVRFRYKSYVAPVGVGENESTFGPYFPGQFAIVVTCDVNWVVICVDGRKGWLYTNEVEFVQRGDLYE